MPIVELQFDDFTKVKSLFTSSKHLNFTIEAAIAGNSPMRVWVDRENSPRSAFLWDTAHCYYFGGEAGNQEFCDSVVYLLKHTIIPHVISRDREIFKIDYTTKEWEPVLKSILKDTSPFKISYEFFILDTPLVPQWRDILPSGFHIRKIDKKLLESNVINLQSIINEINECWYSVDDFLKNGFGFCLVYTPKDENPEIQGWCTGEYFSEGKCGIGIETFHKHRKRGFATAMASAFVEYSMSVNIQPHWNASAINEASIRVAKKVGFKKIQDYSVFFGAFANIESFKGNHYYQKKDFKEAAKWFEKAAESNQRKFYNYYNASCSWALIGEINCAFDNLTKALDHWEDLSVRFIQHMKTDADLVNLYSTKRWKVFLQRLKAIEKIKTKETKSVEQDAT